MYSKLVSFAVPESTTQIGSYAFAYSSDLIGISFSPGLAQIGDYAFRSCSKLQNVTFPDSLISIGSYAFCECSGLTGLSFPANLQSIAENAFLFCGKLNSIIFNGPAVVDEYAFSRCASLQNITFADKANIGSYSFSYCSALNELKLPDNLTAIPAGAFTNCTALSSVQFPDGLTSIAQYAFSAAALESLTLPNSVASIGSSAFSRCFRLTEIHFPASWTKVEPYNGSSPFDQCEALTEITLTDGMTVVPKYAFSGSSSLTSVVFSDSILTIEEYAFDGCTALNDLRLKEGLQSVQKYSFRNCSALETIVLPDSIHSLATFAFSGCTSLVAINHPASWTKTVLISGQPYSPFDNCPSLKTVEVGENVTAIADNAFYGMESLESIELPQGLQSIGSYAFFNCTSLSELALPDTLTTIGAHSLSGCTQLTSLDFPSSIRAIGTISGCTGLTTLIIPDSVTSLGGFPDCSNLVSIKLSNQLTSTGIFSNCTSLETIHFPASLTSIPASAFSNCTSLKSLYLPDTVYSMGSAAFSGCSALSEVNYPKGWGNIPVISVYLETFSPFSNCASLKSMRVAEGENYIPNYAFNGCSSLETVYIPSSVTVIGTDAFKGRSSSLTILGNAGSYAETYAARNQIAFAAMQERVTISGEIRTAEGVAIEEAAVYLTQASDSSRTQSTFTNAQGQWSIQCDAGVSYRIGYRKNGYRISNEISYITPLNDYVLPCATASLVYDGPLSSATTFTMSAAEIPTGTPVTFSVESADAAHVRLIADGVAYEAYAVIDGACRFERKFTQAGARSIQILATTANGSQHLSEPQTLVVTASGTLDSAVFSEQWSGVAGEGLPLAWESVTNATEYVVHLYFDGIPLWSSATQDTSLVIPGNQLYRSGTYSINLMATGEGYSQSSSGAYANIVLPDTTATFCGLCTDENGEPLSGVTIQLAACYEKGYAHQATVASDSSGMWTVQDLTPNCTYQIYWNRDGYECSAEYAVLTASAGVNDLGDIVCTSLGDGPLYLSAEGISHWKDANTQSVTVHAPDVWTASTTDDWFTLSTSDNLLTVSMPENTTGETRTGSVSITSAGYAVVLEVIQEAGDSFSFVTARGNAGTAALSKKEASKLLNYLGGKGSCTWGLFRGYRPHEDLKDYWKLLVGDTKKWDDEKISETSSSFVSWARVRLTIYAAYKSSQEMKIRCEQLMSYAMDNLQMESILQSGAEDLFGEITQTSVLDWTDVESISAALNSATSLAIVARASEAVFILNELDKLNTQNEWESWLANANTLDHTTVLIKMPKELVRYAEIIHSFE